MAETINESPDQQSKEQFMKEAMREAQKALLDDEVPIGCVIVQNGEVISKGYNRRERDQQSLHHAELMAIQKACEIVGSWRLEDCDLYVTLEPCPMCAGAIIQSRIKNVFFGAYDPKGGSCGTVVNLFEIPQYNHHPNYEGGILKEECGQMLSDFFRKKRQEQKLKKKMLKAQSENPTDLNIQSDDLHYDPDDRNRNERMESDSVLEESLMTHMKMKEEE